MFKVLTGERRRRALSPAAFAVSLAAHVALVGGALYAAGAPPEREVVDRFLDLPPLPEEPSPPAPPPAPLDEPAAPPPPDDLLPVEGETLELDAPADVPDRIAPEPPHVRPVDPRHYTGVGRPGDVIGTPQAEPIPLTGNTAVPPTADEVIDETDAEQRPELDRRDLARALERYYPATLREARLEGTVVVEMVVEADGRVRPGSAEVVNASHPAFGHAVLRAVDRFRFTPARVGGVAVPVRVTIPIAWSVPR
jgi:protein TonB